VQEKNDGPRELSWLTVLVSMVLPCGDLGGKISMLNCLSVVILCASKAAAGAAALDEA
jgi:hypothetical protein